MQKLQANTAPLRAELEREGFDLRGVVGCRSEPAV